MGDDSGVDPIDDELRKQGFVIHESGRKVGSGRVSKSDRTSAALESEGKEYTDGMRQTVVADLERLELGDSELSVVARRGDLDTLLNALENLPHSKMAENTAYMIPLIRAWQQQLGRPGNPPIR